MNGKIIKDVNVIRTQGDCKIFMLPGGIEIRYISGQPLMDTGLENSVLIYLFTEKGWPMNKLRQPSERIGSDFLSECRKPITINQIRNIEVAAEAALKPISDIGLGTISGLTARMKTGNQIFLSFTVNPPGTDAQTFLLSGFANNWIIQKEGVIPRPPSVSPDRYLLDDDGGILYDDGLRPLND